MTSIVPVVGLTFCSNPLNAQPSSEGLLIVEVR